MLLCTEQTPLGNLAVGDGVMKHKGKSERERGEGEGGGGGGGALIKLTGRAIALATKGPTIPGRVPAVFVSAIRTPAYLGAMSRWLILKPAMDSPPQPTPSVSRVTAMVADVP